MKSVERIAYEELYRTLDKKCGEADVTAAVAEGYPYRVTFTEKEQPSLLDDYEEGKQGRASIAVIIASETHLIIGGRLTINKATMKKLIKSAEDLAQMWILAFVAENWKPEETKTEATA